MPYRFAKAQTAVIQTSAAIDFQPSTFTPSIAAYLTGKVITTGMATEQT